MVPQRNMAALLGEAAAFTPGYACNYLVSTRATTEVALFSFAGMVSERRGYLNPKSSKIARFFCVSLVVYLRWPWGFVHPEEVFVFLQVIFWERS